MLKTLSKPTPDEILQFPAIDPLPDEISRPFWSVMIPTYNGTKYLEKTLEGVLKQDPGSSMMQIEVVDDCSTKDDPELLVKEIGQGRVLFYRNPQNLGLLTNWDTCIRRARGHWVHLLHQDDLVLPGFYQQMKAGLENNLAAGMGVCRHAYIDEDGHWTHLSPLERREVGVLQHHDWLEKIGMIQRIQFPAIVIKRDVYEKLGGFCLQAASAADWEMWKRIAVHYPVWYEPQILACFRRHSSSTSSGLIQRGENITDSYKAIDISESYLPKEISSHLSNKARANYAASALGMAHLLVGNNEIHGAIAQFKQSLKFPRSPSFILSAMSFCLKLGKRQLAGKK